MPQLLQLVCSALWLHLAFCCSSIRIKAPTTDVIARTMELAAGGKAGVTWSVSLYPRGGSHRQSLCGEGMMAWQSVYGYVGIDSPPPHLTTDGINERGLTVSEHTLRGAGYQPVHAGGLNLCWLDLTPWALANFETVAGVVAALQNVSVVKTVPGGRFHWAVDDAVGGHAVIEYVAGTLRVHNNSVGVLTNDPPYAWHLENLNTYVGLSSAWPTGDEGIQVETEIGATPSVIGHGFNLMGIPGDYSPRSRFVRLFYLRQYAELNDGPPRTLDSALRLGAGLLNNVFMMPGTVADDPKHGDHQLSFTQYSLLKLPQARQLYFKPYGSLQWAKVDLNRVDFTKRSTMPLDDGTLGVRDRTHEI
eukprot:NODE_895_length_1249_cov_112.442500_g664_i0.p1 GENE.NODE_895_length_1249_cov_112.442500_g664_i0~~NODE_895_length_1249_cov_112.442500_g664_i0.p1  ORF type:complete len:361 (+),score=50.44 NODE_895_length_1249_cov_112.442500_g664_i0:74-1156(+)